MRARARDLILKKTKNFVETIKKLINVLDYILTKLHRFYWSISSCSYLTTQSTIYLRLQKSMLEAYTKKEKMFFINFEFKKYFILISETVNS